MEKKTLIKAGVGVALVAAAFGAYRTFGWGHWSGPVNRLGLDLAAPDALIVTHSLAALPRDLLTIPLARDVLREEFLFYYEQNEDTLGIKGSLRRIAYEHELGWGDRLLRMVLDQPADVALWRDADGTLKHFAIAVSRGGLARIVEEAGKVALKDAQMRLAGELTVDGANVKVFALEYGRDRTLLFAAHGDRLVILSHAGMLYGGTDGKKRDDKAEQTVIGLLAKDKARQHLFHDQFRLPHAPAQGHSVAVKADFLSFGYQPFFAGLQALRFDFSKGAWRSQALLDAAKLGKGGYNAAALWRVLPHNPSACFIVPADWMAMQPVLEHIDGKAPLAPLAGQMSGPAAACWYGDSRLHTPVFVATRAAGAGGTEALLGDLFAATVGGKGAAAPKTADGAVRWGRGVKTSQGDATPTLALAGDVVAFSADARLVDRVLAVRRKQAPAVADKLADAGRTVGVIAPAALARLIETEAFGSLPANQEPVLRAAADAHLVPRLAALKKYPPYRMVLTSVPKAGIAWTPLEWQAMAR